MNVEDTFVPADPSKFQGPWLDDRDLEATLGLTIEERVGPPSDPFSEDAEVEDPEN